MPRSPAGQLPTRNLRVASIQCSSSDDLPANLQRAAILLAQARDGGAELALLPENFAFMGADDAARRSAADPAVSARVLSFLAEQAERLGMFIIGGAIALHHKPSGKLRNHSPVFAPDGSKIAGYDKIHLFDADPADDEHYRESALFHAGDRPATVAVHGWKIGLSICYDLRFPDLYQHYAREGCALFSVPAAFTVPTGRAHWSVLLRARAIENHCYLLAAGQWGCHPGGRETWGHSMIVDPWGEVCACRQEGVGVIIAELSAQWLATVRRRFRKECC